jgi:hypothetical protein
MATHRGVIGFTVGVFLLLEAFDQMQVEIVSRVSARPPISRGATRR